MTAPKTDDDSFVNKKPRTPTPTTMKTTERAERAKKAIPNVKYEDKRVCGGRSM